MKIKRFVAPDMRQAIRQVRETLGPDAVILSNKTLADGVELVAAKDYDETALLAAPEESAPYDNKVVSVDAARRHIPAVSQAADTLPPHSTNQATTPQGATKAEQSQEPALVEMRSEMRAMRRMMENELFGLSWRDMGEHSPLTQELLRQLMALDLSPELCRNLSRSAGDASSVDQAFRLALSQLADALPVATDDYLDQGGAIAMIGPTGVGKTTSIAKLAARFCLRHGSRHLALVTTDNYRIGAQEQLHTYGRILDVPVRTAADDAELNNVLNHFADKRLVLIDTAGMSQRDLRISEQLRLLRSGNRPVRNFLVLSATTQQSTLQQVIQSFSAAQPAACILSKVDEAGSLGGPLSALVRSRLPLAYISDGQKVPEDLQIARAHPLISRAVALSQEVAADFGEDYLALALGGVHEHAHI